MAAKPFSAGDPVEQIDLEHNGCTITAILTITGEMILSDDTGEIHRYPYCGRRTNLPAIIDSIERAITDLEWRNNQQRGLLSERPD